MTSTGPPDFGQAIAISPAASLPLLPVLSPTFQSPGRPPRSRLLPVLQPTIHAVRCARESGVSTVPSRKRRRFPAIADGVGGLWGSPGGERLSSGSLWSRRETVSPARRQNSVKAAGPPTRASSRFAQVLSLSSTIALHISATDMAPWARFRFATVIENVLGPIGDHVLEMILATVDPRQHEGGQ